MKNTNDINNIKRIKKALRSKKGADFLLDENFQEVFSKFGENGNFNLDPYDEPRYKMLIKFLFNLTDEQVELGWQSLLKQLNEIRLIKMSFFPESIITPIIKSLLEDFPVEQVEYLVEQSNKNFNLHILMEAKKNKLLELLQSLPDI